LSGAPGQCWYLLLTSIGESPIRRKSIGVGIQIHIGANNLYKKGGFLPISGVIALG
jgi:hypothetical protein